MKKLFEPITIKNMKIKNRMVVSAMVTGFCGEDGNATEQFIAYHEAKAKGGWGLIIPEDYVIAKGVGGQKNLPGLYDDSQIASHRILTERIHATGSKIFCQIYHAGRRIIRAQTGLPPVGPSALPFAGAQSEVAQALSVAEIEQIIQDFVACARRVKEAGFDGVEIHGGHGYLLHTFVSPFSNKRSDLYGGTIYGRARFSLEVVRQVRAAVGDDFPISYRMSSLEYVDGGISIAEAKILAVLLEEAGVDLLHVSQGGDFNYVVAPASCMPKACYIDNAAAIKEVVKIPVIGVGRINDPFIAESVLQSGKADMVTMARSSIADPQLPNKAQAGAFDEINYCIGCLQGCTSGCLVNPLSGRESIYSLAPVSEPKHVLVVGGGVSGCEAAIASATKGHHVTIFEQTDCLGGQWLAACVPPGKTDFATFVIWQKKQLEKLGVRVMLNTKMTGEDILHENPDVVIVATGSKPFLPPIQGIEKNHVITAQDVLLGRVVPGANVVVIGGGSVGAETADFMATNGSRVSVLEMQSVIAGDASDRPRKFLMERLEKNKVALYTSAKVCKIEENAVIAETAQGTLELNYVDTVVIAVGAKADKPLLQQLEHYQGQILLTGDTAGVKDGAKNIRQSFELGLTI